MDRMACAVTGFSTDPVTVGMSAGQLESSDHTTDPQESPAIRAILDQSGAPNRAVERLCSPLRAVRAREVTDTNLVSDSHTFRE